MRLDEYSDLPAENATLNNAQPVRFLHSARHVLVAIFLVFLVVLLLIQFARSSPLQNAVIARLTISSQSTTGVTFQAPVNGFYIFEYAAGGFLVYNLEEGEPCDRTSFECYSSALVAFRGKTVLRRGQDIKMDA